MFTKKEANEIGEKILQQAADEWYKTEDYTKDVRVCVTFKEVDNFRISAYFGGHGAGYGFGSQIVYIYSNNESKSFDNLDDAYNFLKTTRKKAFKYHHTIEIKIQWAYSDYQTLDVELPKLTIKKIDIFTTKR